MAVAASTFSGVLVRSLRGISYRLSEIVHVCAIYLGITVLVAGVLAFVVPSLREQVREVHEALIIALQPDSAGSEMLHALADPDGNLYLPGREPGRLPPEDAQTAGVAESATRPPAGAQLSFAQALRASEAGRHAVGLTRAQAEALRSYISRKFRIAGTVAARWSIRYLLLPAKGAWTRNWCWRSSRSSRATTPMPRAMWGLKG